MRVKCEYCGNYILDTDKICPQCGAPNAHMQRSADGVPKTIDELRAFCEAKKLPLKKMRFFIGEDYRGPKAFGIYRDADDVVVYKNKADGSRAVRYRGTDEAYAVNEIYQKLKSEISLQRSRSANAGGGGKTKGFRAFLPTILALLLGANLVVGAVSALKGNGPSNGYYYYGDTYYYNQNDSWFEYDSTVDEWYPTTVDETLTDHYDDYFASSSYSSSYEASDFSDSSYYVEPSYESSWDDDDDWDWGGDWDSGATDWDSDW